MGQLNTEEISRTVQRDGWALAHDPSFLDGEGYSTERLLAIAKAFGRPSDRDGGLEAWPVAPQGDSLKLTFSMRSGAVPLHTDAQYQRDPEEVVVLFCVRPATEGGVSLLLDSRAVWERLTSFPLLDRPVWRFRTPRVFDRGECCDPVSILDARRIRWRPDNIIPPESSEATEVVNGVTGLFETSGAIRSLPLQSGDMLIIDNTRVLHGRSEFHDPGRLLVRVRLWRIA